MINVSYRCIFSVNEIMLCSIRFSTFSCFPVNVFQIVVGPGFPKSRYFVVQLFLGRSCEYKSRVQVKVLKIARFFRKDKVQAFWAESKINMGFLRLREKFFLLLSSLKVFWYSKNCQDLVD